MLAAVRLVQRAGNESSLSAFSGAFEDIVTGRDRSHCQRKCRRCIEL